MTVLDARLARRIIDNLGSAGQPPEYGVQYFTVGLDPYLDGFETTIYRRSSEMAVLPSSWLLASTVVERLIFFIQCEIWLGNRTLPSHT